MEKNDKDKEEIQNLLDNNENNLNKEILVTNNKEKDNQTSIIDESEVHHNHFDIIKNTEANKLSSNNQEKIKNSSKRRGIVDNNDKFELNNNSEISFNSKIKELEESYELLENKLNDFEKSKIKNEEIIFKYELIIDTFDEIIASLRELSQFKGEFPDSIRSLSADEIKLYYKSIYNLLYKNFALLSDTIVKYKRKFDNLKRKIKTFMEENENSIITIQKQKEFKDKFNIIISTNYSEFEN